MKIRTVFQIVFCILSVVCLLAAVLLGIFLGFLYALIGVGGTLIFFILMMIMKHGLPFMKKKAEPRVDFMNSEEENEAIRRALESSENTGSEN